MKIKWTLDIEEGIDPIELLGNITIHDNNQNSITDEAIYIDSFYYSLSEGLLKAKPENQLVIKQFDNPNNITFVRYNENLEIKYKETKILVSYNDAVHELCGTYKELTKAIGGKNATSTYTELNENISMLCEKQF